MDLFVTFARDDFEHLDSREMLAGADEAMEKHRIVDMNGQVRACHASWRDVPAQRQADLLQDRQEVSRLSTQLMESHHVIAQGFRGLLDAF